ncbi:MAG: IclR family transcriptional regulator [Castellaniella sp.]|uniref:IclR family transcriptional regulator n=1 Tax=Castellaniella sp. TaxID=1955812 RepID=UPI00121F2B37|nr:IclR family transcriptional regulator [Castellaniella sp.]TAN28050.1 MAG: IclR family transcriptional regulator [Castellaniella sp.]
MSQTEKLEAAQGVQSVEIGLSLFGCLSRRSEPCSLSDLAREAGMHRAKAYRYLVSLQRAGWVTQDPSTALYDLGPAMRDLALRWLTHQSTLNLAIDEARLLSQSQGETCFVAVWGVGGATAVRVFQPSRVVAISIAEGAVLDAVSSATGRVFAVWREESSSVLSARIRAEIREKGFAAVEGEHVAGINAISAPVFDEQGRPVLALTLVGPASSLDTGANGKPARALLAACQRISLAPDRKS